MPVIGTMNGKNDDDDDDCLNEIRALAGIDRMLIPVPLMRKLASFHETIETTIASTG
jgi:hypothetical protein